MKYINHVALPGQRWDNISHLYYRDALNYSDIVRENPDHNDVVVFAGGEVIRVPEIEKTTTANAGLPPWK